MDLQYDFAKILLRRIAGNVATSGPPLELGSSATSPHTDDFCAGAAAREGQGSGSTPRRPTEVSVREARQPLAESKVRPSAELVYTAPMAYTSASVLYLKYVLKKVRSQITETDLREVPVSSNAHISFQCIC